MKKNYKLSHAFYSIDRGTIFHISNTKSSKNCELHLCMSLWNWYLAYIRPVYSFVSNIYFQYLARFKNTEGKKPLGNHCFLCGPHVIGKWNFLGRWTRIPMIKKVQKRYISHLYPHPSTWNKSLTFVFWIELKGSMNRLTLVCFRQK